MSDLMMKVMELDNEINSLCNVVNNYNLDFEDLEMACGQINAKVMERDYVLSVIEGMVA